MPYFIDAYLTIRNYKRRICGYIGEYKEQSDSIHVNGHRILKGDIVAGPTHTVKASLKEYVNFRGIEMEVFNKRNVDADEYEYLNIGNKLRDRLASRLSMVNEQERLQLIKYFDMQIVIEKTNTDRIARLNSHVTRILTDHKQILSVIRSSEHAKRNRVNRQSYRC